MIEKDFIETYKWIEKKAERYAIKNSNLHIEIVNAALDAWKHIEQADTQTIKEFCLKTIRQSYENRKNNDMYAANKIVNVGTDCNLFYSKGEREDGN